MIQGIVSEQKEAVQIIIRDGLIDGRNPNSVALDLMGRMDEGKRVGGVLGLHSRQAQAVVNMRRDLESISEGGYSTYRSRKLRNKIFDRLVEKAYREGKTIAQADIDRITNAYAQRMALHRGKMIARTESLTAISAGNYEGLSQLVEEKGYNPEDVTLEWDSSGDKRVRPSHVALDNKKIKFGETFTSPTTGAQMRFPRDTSMGAHGEDVINCRCWMKVKFNYENIYRTN